VSEVMLERIMRRAVPVTESGCLLWEGYCNKCGYGCIRHKGKSWLTHRLVYELKHGSIPPDLSVCHHCDVPACINLEHLFLGTRSDNTRDAQRKGRFAPTQGSHNGNAKLTEDQVRWAREQYARYGRGEGGSHAICERLGIKQQTLSDIIARRKWPHVK